jgi:hypothetical protein
MGYDVRFAKPQLPGQPEDVFDEDEWRAFQAKHPGMNHLYFDGGRIVCKNPSESQLVHLAKLAYEKGWRLRGDDGEYYDDNGQVIQEQQPSRGWLSRVTDYFANARAARELEQEMHDVECVFKLGDRVRSTHRTGGVVTRIDKQANSGLGIIEVTFPDGAVIGGMFPDGGFEPEQQ